MLLSRLLKKLSSLLRWGKEKKPVQVKKRKKVRK